MPDSDSEFFSAPSPTSDLSRHADRVEPLPADPGALGEIVRGLLMHNFDAEMRGIASSPDRDAMRTFGAGRIVDRIVQLDDHPLEHQRPENERLIGYCYHFALVHCALLRAKGVAARARCGFAGYLVDGKWIDHWVVELWDGQRWLLHDSQIGLDDLSHEQFRSGVEAWELCRAGEADAFAHGIGDLWGWDELRASLVNDIGCLNKVEIGDWDWCAALRVDPLDQPSALIDDHLDTLAQLGAPDASLGQLRNAFTNDALARPPEQVDDAASPR